MFLFILGEYHKYFNYWLLIHTTKYVENHIAKDGTYYKIVGCNEGLNANKSVSLEKII